MHRNKSVVAHQFSMVPRNDVPRSTFKMPSAHKAPIDSGILYPFYLEEILPGDSFKVRATLFGRLATPIFPFMDNLKATTFFFFCPSRIVWDNWEKFIARAQNNPGDSTDFVTPKMTSPVGGYAIGSLQDHFALPTVGQVDSASTVTHVSLPLRIYNKIYNEWFKDENLIDDAVVDYGDGPDDPADYVLRRRAKRPDYFTTCLPWPQKGESVGLPLGLSAPLRAEASAGNLLSFQTPGGVRNLAADSGSSGRLYALSGSADPSSVPLFADLSEATAATINQLRQAFAIQGLLEKDARGGTRYVESLWNHWGVRSPDARLQRPEYLGGSSVPINVNPIAQTSASNVTGGSTPQGNLAAMGTMLASSNGFSHSFVEHGYVLGIVCVDADLSYQQGTRRHWFRDTAYDYYIPTFASLGEMAVLNREIYTTGLPQDEEVFGYQESWGDYRNHPSTIVGLFRSTAANTIDQWHLSQRFNSLPTLNQTFIESRPPLDRVLAVHEAALGQQLILDVYMDVVATRPLPMYGIPGLRSFF